MAWSAPTTTRPYFCRGKQRFNDYEQAARLAHTWAARKRGLV